MDAYALNDVGLAALMTLPTAKCRLTVMLDARKRRGEPTDDLEAELASNRAQAREFAAFLSTNVLVDA